jgi:hypothetical protein
MKVVKILCIVLSGVYGYAEMCKKNSFVGIISVEK